MKLSGLCIPYPRLLVERAYKTFKASSEVLVDALPGGTKLKYVSHKRCVIRVSADGQKQQGFLEKAALKRRKELADRAELNSFWRAMENGAWLTAIPHHLNSMELSREEFQDNLLLCYGIVPLNLITDCDGCGKKFSVPHALSCPKGGLFMAWHNDAAK